MLTKYSKLKEVIADTEASIKKKREEVNNKQELINNLKVKLQYDKDEREKKVREQIEEILESKISAKRNAMEYDKQVLRQFKHNELEKIELLRARAESPDNVDSGDYKNSFNDLMKLKTTVEDELAKYITKEEIEWYGGLGYGRDLLSDSLDSITENMEYLHELDNYDSVKLKLTKADDKISSFETSAVILVGFIIIAIMIIYKYIIFIPLLGYLVGCVFIRVKHFYYMLEVVDAFSVINSEVEKSLNMYEHVVTDALSDITTKLDAAKAYVEQLCNSIERQIESELNTSIQHIRLNFDRDKARADAEKSVDSSDTHLVDTINCEQEEYDEMMSELISMNEDLSGYKDKLKQLKIDINNVYQKLEPSFSEKLILKEFFLGFDSDEEPVTFKYGGKSTLILYDGSDGNQINYVMTTIKMMCGQIMCSMYPLSYEIFVVDCYTSGVALAPFQVKQDDGEGNGDTALFKIIPTNSATKKHVESLYKEFLYRRVDVLGSYKDIEDLNKHKLKYKAKTMQYKISFFYNFDYSLFKDDEMIHQLCRVSESVGIIPIFFMDIRQFGEDDRENGKKYKYNTEVILDALDLFDNNVFGFRISQSGVDISNYNLEALKRELRR